jgi:23S rRNA (cytidine1920-2'-O)/16S rRNA (cytidine1409-2'-O)-methyltransferase
MERMNARNLGPGTFPEPIQLATVDVSFISLGLVLGPVASTFGPAGGSIVALVKPQFEAGRAEARGGVVRDPGVHLGVLERVAARARELGLGVLDMTPSPILGPAGNREFLVHLGVGPAAASNLATERLRERLAAAVDG